MAAMPERYREQVMRNGKSPYPGSNRNLVMDSPERGILHHSYLSVGSERCEESLGLYPGCENYSGTNPRQAKRPRRTVKEIGAEMMVAMVAVVRTTRAWWLIGVIILILFASIYPSVTEVVYPVIDTTGSNMMNMSVDKKAYNCGEVVNAYFLFQKQQNKVGTIKWKLVPNRPNAEAYTYAARPVGAPVGITAHWAKIEALPEQCSSGEYHFEGTLTYPLFLGSVSYPLRTSCFEIRAKR